MKRKDFLKTSTILGAIGITLPHLLKANKKKGASTYSKMLKQVGFNHLPNKENKTMNTVLHKANTRGHANHGWLNSHHSFSFANYHNPERMNFGVLRVLNDDTVAPGMGFSKHPHDNMEIISITLEGDLEHKDSMGNHGVIKQGEIQVMSAGTGVFHSEFNKNKNQQVKFLQIWVFPNQKNVAPRYDQISIAEISQKNVFNQILSPSPNDQGVWIHQNAWFHLGEFNTPTNAAYSLKNKENGVYVFVIEGEAEVNGQSLEQRDGFGVWDVEQFNIKASESSKLLLIEVPMLI